MDGQDAIRKLLVHARQSSALHLATIQEALPLTRSLLKEELKAYVLAKYLLTEAELPPVLTFDQLTELSLAKSMQVSPALVKEFDTAQSCDGATSAMVKKVLLFRSLERNLKLQLPATRSARLKSLDDLSDMVWDTMQKDADWYGRLSAEG